MSLKISEKAIAYSMNRHKIGGISGKLTLGHGRLYLEAA